MALNQPISRRPVTRRGVLKLAGSAAGAALSMPFVNLLTAWADEMPVETDPEPEPPPSSLGRVANWTVEIREQPRRTANLVRSAKRDEVFPLREQVKGEAVMSHNDVWFKLDGGYAYSS